MQDHDHTDFRTIELVLDNILRGRSGYFLFKNAFKTFRSVEMGLGDSVDFKNTEVVLDNILNGRSWL